MKVIPPHLSKEEKEAIVEIILERVFKQAEGLEIPDWVIVLAGSLQDEE